MYMHHSQKNTIRCGHELVICSHTFSIRAHMLSQSCSRPNVSVEWDASCCCDSCAGRTSLTGSSADHRNQTGSILRPSRPSSVTASNCSRQKGGGSAPRTHTHSPAEARTHGSIERLETLHWGCFVFVSLDLNATLPGILKMWTQVGKLVLLHLLLMELHCAKGKRPLTLHLHCRARARVCMYDRCNNVPLWDFTFMRPFSPGSSHVSAILLT